MRLLIFPLILASIELTTATYNPYNETFVFRKDFLDRSDLLATLFNYSSSRLGYYFTCPHRFGKTMLLRMIQKFSEVETDIVHLPLPKQATESHWLFNSLKISHQNWTYIHLARHPVVYINFTHVMRKYFENNVEENVLHYMNLILGQVFDNFKWLPIFCWQIKQKQYRLREHEMVFIDTAVHRNLKKVDILSSLEILVTSLFKFHNGTRVLILIDELDKPLHDVLSSTENFSDEMVYLYNLLWDMINQLIKTARPYIGKIVITGVSNIVFSSKFVNSTAIDRFKFLDDHYLRSFYGFTESNMGELYDWYKCDEDEINRVRNFYKPYKTKHERLNVYNPYSITRYFGDKEFHNITEPKLYWNLGEQGDFMYKFLKSYEFLEMSCKLYFNRSIKVELGDDYEPSAFDVFLLGMEKDFVVEEFPFVGMLWYFCFEQGLIKYTTRNNTFKVPNLETIKIFEDYLIGYFDRNAINLWLIGQNISDFVNNHTTYVGEIMKNMKTSLNEQFAKLRISNGNFSRKYTYLAIVHFAIMKSAMADQLVQLKVKKSNPLDLVYVYNETAFGIALQQRGIRGISFTLEELNSFHHRVINRRSTNIKYWKVMYIYVTQNATVLKTDIVLEKLPKSRRAVIQ